MLFFFEEKDRERDAYSDRYFSGTVAVCLWAFGLWRTVRRPATSIDCFKVTISILLIHWFVVTSNIRKSNVNWCSCFRFWLSKCFSRICDSMSEVQKKHEFLKIFWFILVLCEPGGEFDCNLINCGNEEENRKKNGVVYCPSRFCCFHGFPLAIVQMLGLAMDIFQLKGLFVFLCYSHFPILRKWNIHLCKCLKKNAI